MREFSNGHRHANKVRMLRSSNARLSFLLVEGDTDARFYGQFVCARLCRVVNTSGRQHAIEAGRILSDDGFVGFVVLVDQDDWCVDGSAPRLAYLITTDGRDLESTLLRGGVGLRLLAQYGDRGWLRRIERDTGKPLLDLLAEWTAAVGVIRWISNQRNLGLKTRDVDVTDFVDFDSWSVSLEEVAREILRRSGGGGGVPFEDALCDLVSRARNMLGTTRDKWVFCSGHDMCRTLMRGLIRKFGNNTSEQLTLEVFEASVRACCSPTEFAMTLLYRKIREWERRNAPFRVLASSLSSSKT